MSKENKKIRKLNSSSTFVNTLACAVLDRLLHYSYIIIIIGNSYRIKDKIIEIDSITNEYNE